MTTEFIELMKIVIGSSGLLGILIGLLLVIFRTGKIVQKIETMDHRLDRMDQRLDRMDAKISGISEQTASIDQRISRIEGYLMGPKIFKQN